MDGAPSFFELGVPDADKARAFYSALFDWQYKPVEATGGTWIATPYAAIRGGVHGDDSEPGIELYFRVADIDASVAKVRQLGGQAEDPGPETPRFGRFCRCRDDQGVRFGLHQTPRG